MKKLTTIVLALIVMTLGTLVGCQSSSPASPLKSNSSPVLPSSVAFFPVALDKYTGQAYPAALAKGTLVLENGYLRLGSFPETGETSLVVWPPGFSVREESGVVQVLFPDGTLAASVGDSLDLGGGDVPLEIVEKYIGKSLPANCPGPFWLTGNVAYSSALIPMTSVPESDLTHITFSLGWILKNNMFQNDSNTVKITFPASWLNNAPPVPDGEIAVSLRVPLQMLNLHNTSQNPEEITVVFPNAYFEGMPVAQYVPGTPSPQLIREPPEINFFTPPGVNPPAKDLEISAISGPLDWELATDSGWLTLSSVSGTATAQKETVVVSAGAAGLSAGTYNGTVTLRQKGTDRFQEIPVRLFITSAKTGTPLDIPVEAAEGTAFKEGIQLGQTTITTGTTMADGATSWPGGYSGAGDLCLLVRGRFLNTTPEKLTIDFLANGLDGDGKQVSWNLTSGPLIGIAQKDVPANSAVDFQLVLTWAENVNMIKIIANIHHW